MPEIIFFFGAFLSDWLFLLFVSTRCWIELGAPRPQTAATAAAVAVAREGVGGGRKEGGVTADRIVSFWHSYEGKGEEEVNGEAWGRHTGGGLSVATMRTCLRGLALHSDTGSTPPAGHSPSAPPLKGVWEQDPSQGSEVDCMS